MKNYKNKLRGAETKLIQVLSTKNGARTFLIKWERPGMPVAGTLIEKVKQMDVENATKIKDFEINARNEWSMT